MYKTVNFDLFKSMLQLAAEDMGTKAHCVTIPETQELGCKYFLHADGMSGFALKGNDMRYVFNVSDTKGLFGIMVMFAEAFARQKDYQTLTLECFDPLLRCYESHGFVVTQSFDWDDDQKPDNWDYKALGTPNYNFMVKLLDALGTTVPVNQQIPVAA